MLRSMVENLLVLKYLEANPTLYSKFEEYGLGQLKLYKGHLQDLEESQESPDPGLTELIDDLEAAVNSERSEEFLPINLGTWSEKPERLMAQEVGMEDDYKFLYQPCSIDVHSEWPSITKWNMLRCRNPLHHFHYVPNFSRPGILIPGSLVPVASDLFERTVNLVSSALEFSMPTVELLAPLQTLRENIIERLSPEALAGC
jgi:hypothetical protein